MKLFLILAGLAVAMGACPNACSGHGVCGLSSKCNCQARWIGNDCSQRECPHGLSWIVSSSNTNVPAGGALGGYHPYAECSNRGTCDRDAGQCECHEGYEGRGCRRTACPNACSGHGFCKYNYEVNSAYAGYGTGSTRRRYDVEQWDARKTRQCVCDRGYEGTDCSSRICPKGDDPLTECNENPGTSVNDVQNIQFSGSGYGASKFFSITFTDMFSGVYTTRPIATGFTQTDLSIAQDVEAALEELPNFAIPNVTVSASYSNPNYIVSVTFVDAANSGEQNLMEISSTADHNNAAMQPRFDQATGTMTVAHAAVGSDDQLEEHTECSNRGSCDGDSGLCQCYEGFTGEACQQQTVFF